MDAASDPEDLPALIGPLLEAEVGAKSHPGRMRENNEDHYLIGRLARSLEIRASNLPAGHLPGAFEEAGWFFVVADGMGGAEAGEVASRIAIEAGLLHHLARPSWYLRSDEEAAGRVLDRMRDLLDRVHADVVKAAAANSSLAGMGTTLTAAYATGAHLFLAHVGDSRAYLLRDGDLHQLSRDQTLVQELVDQGSIQPEAAARHPLRHVLTHAVGSEKLDRLPSELRHFELEEGDRLLLCTDGLTDPVDAKTIAAVLAESADPGAACERLVATALERGAPDNVTVVAAFLRLASPPKP
jgi:protein phosphatase